MFEHKSEPLVTRWAFYARMAQSAAIVAGIIACSLFVGSAGYHYLGDLPWIDSHKPPSRHHAGDSLVFAAKLEGPQDTRATEANDKLDTTRSAISQQWLAQPAILGSPDSCPTTNRSSFNLSNCLVRPKPWRTSSQ